MPALRELELLSKVADQVGRSHDECPDDNFISDHFKIIHVTDKKGTPHHMNSDAFRDLQRWSADSTLGPRMRKAVEKVLGNLQMEGSSYHEARTGFFGDPVDPSDLRFHTTSIFLGVGERDVHPDKQAHWERALAAEIEVRECFGYTLTAENYKRVIAAYEAALIDLALHRPVIDERRTRDEDEELKVVLAERKVKDDEVRAERDAMSAKVDALAPSWAKSVILAQLKEDADIMSDYSANHAVRTVVIGFSTKTREDFSELHKVAGTFPETAHLASQEALNAWCDEKHGTSRGYGHYVAEKAGEHRDNYSMGKGNYLSDHGWDGGGSGWTVVRRTLPLLGGWPTVTEIAPGLEVAA